jgi:chromosome segregation ATPase
MKKTVAVTKVTNLNTNGFATKEDIKKLKESLNERFDRFEHRFEWFKDDWDWWKKDTFRLFEHRWQQLIDPVLKEIADMRESDEIEIGRSAENRERLDAIGGKVEKLDVRMEKIENRMGKVENKIDSVGTTLGKIARKVGA